MEVLNVADLPEKSRIRGSSMKAVHSASMTACYWRFEPGIDLPEHAHPHEQVTSIISGEFDLTLADETRRLTAGSVVVIPPNVPHRGHSVTEVVVIDIFHPCREDFR
jgi:quercetin dioxygenase-like cupin family protein